MFRFIFHSIRGRVIGTLLMLGIGGVILLATGRLDDDLRSQEEKRQDQVDRTIKSVDDTAQAASSGLRIYEADTRLMVDGDYERYRIGRIEMAEGDLNVFTKLPPGRASERKVARLCAKLIGGEQPLLEVRDFVFVFGEDLTHIRADQCDIQYWQDTGPAVG